MRRKNVVQECDATEMKEVVALNKKYPYITGDVYRKRKVLIILVEIPTMVEIICPERFNDFLSQNSDEILGNYFTYFHFIKAIPLLDNGSRVLYDFYNVRDHQGNQIIAVLMTGVYYLYSNAWTDEMAEKLLEKIDLARFKQFHFVGQRDLILIFFPKVVLNMRWSRIGLFMNVQKLKT